MTSYLVWIVTIQVFQQLLLTVGGTSSTFRWRAGTWGACQNNICGLGGTQSRDVTCVNSASRPVVPSQCGLQHKPVTTRSCFRVCQHHRFQYVWKIDEWAPCQPRHGYATCEEPTGIETRNVTCIAKCGSLAPTDYICEYFNPRPPNQRVCEQNCPRDCIATVGYGPFTDCDTCWVKHRVRMKMVLAGPEHGGRDCGTLVEKNRCPKRKECDEHRRESYQYKVGNWTHCMPSQNQQASTVLGHKRRTVGCINAQGTPVEDIHCSHTVRPNSSSICILARDCLVSHLVDWTNWTSASHSFQTKPSRTLLARYRSVLQVPPGEGDICPDLPGETKAAIAEIPDTCHLYKWIRGAWSECKLPLDNDRCGTGVKQRTVLCVRASDTVPVEDHHCALRSPAHTRTCSIPCPQDCLLSTWSLWSQCNPEQCRIDRAKTRTGHRMRSRNVLREGDYGGEQCGHVHEYQPCDYPECNSWKITPSQQCSLVYPEMLCGQGHRNITSVCVNNLYGDEVDESLCDETRPALSESCYMPCANDCVTSQWSEWSRCSKSCGEGRVAGHRTRWRDARAQPGSGGRPCPSMRMLIEKEPCNEVPCFSYNWVTSEWSACHVIKGKCGAGRQFRDVECFRSSMEKVSNKRCRAEDAPSESQNCSLACPNDCLVSAFTDWSSCPVSCYNEGSEMPEQLRQRFILEEPSSEGLSCPELFEFRRCLNMPLCVDYMWSKSEWSNCLFARSSMDCGVGYRTRDVRCKNDRGEYLEADVCIRELGEMPDTTSPCQVPCGQGHCKFSDWSEWSPCSVRCGGHRVRQRFMEGMTTRNPACYQMALYPRKERRFCGCPQFNTELIGYWSHCVLDPSHLDFDPEPSDASIGQMKANLENCGRGRRLQALICRSNSGYNASASVCGSSDFDSEMCFLPCPRDCVMSAWTSWSECSLGGRCGIGRQSRYRYMRETSLDGGRECPQLVDEEQYQNRSCKISCDKYYWHADDWRFCTPLASSSDHAEHTCGPGLQSRIVRCIERGGSESGREKLVNDHGLVEGDVVNPTFCDSLLRPDDLRHCQIPCAGDCVVAEWSAWSVCDQVCAGSQVRQRVILRNAAGDGSKQCPHLTETQQCRRGANCWQYQWEHSNSNVCVLKEDALCGTGYMQRFRVCVRSEDRKPVSDMHCQEGHSAEVDEFSSITPCHVPCPVDCAVSTWSTWSQCTQTCGYGVQNRWRAVIIQPDYGGRRCPEYLEQQKPCPYVECFHWHLSDWGPCVIETHTCGYGMQRRNLTCMRHDGVTSEAYLCPQDIKNYLQIEISCHLACPGDCNVTPWSQWGECHRPCDAPHDTRGRQTRYRAIVDYPQPGGEPCPPNLMETRACSGGPCPRYSWNKNLWFGDRRHVWCESEDGLRVQGACRDTDQPPVVKTCDPPCPSKRSYCRDTNTCDCVRGYFGIWTADGNTLINCTVRRISQNSSDGIYKTDEQNEAQYFSDGGPSNFWIYAVIAAGGASFIFVVIAVYAICRHTHRREPQVNGEPPPAAPKDITSPHHHGLTSTQNGTSAKAKHTRLAEIS